MPSLTAVLLLAYLGAWPRSCHAYESSKQHAGRGSVVSDPHKGVPISDRQRRLSESATLEEPKGGFTSKGEIISYTRAARLQPSTPHGFRLDGESFTFRAYEVSPFLERIESNDGKLNYEGFSADLLDALSDKAGFTYSFAYPNSTVAGRQGPIIDVANGVADATIGPIVPYSTTYPVHFTASYLDTGLVLVTFQDLDSGTSLFDPRNMISWMKPFTWSVWGTIVSIIIVYALIMFYLERDDTASVDFDAPEEQGVHGILKSVWLSSATFIGQLTGHVPGSAVGMLFMQVTAFVAVIVASSYTANLATSLTANRVASAKATITSIHDAQAKASRICVGSLSTASSVLSSSYDRIRQMKISRNSSEEENAVGIEYMQKNLCAGMVMDQIDAHAIKFALNEDGDDPCMLRVRGSVFLSQSHAIVVRKVGIKNANYTRLRKLRRSLDFFLTQMREDGSMSKIFAIDDASDEECLVAVADTNQISVSQVIGPLIVFLSIALVALIGKAYQLVTGRKVLHRGLSFTGN